MAFFFVNARHPGWNYSLDYYQQYRADAKLDFSI